MTYKIYLLPFYCRQIYNQTNPLPKFIKLIVHLKLFIYKISHNKAKINIHFSYP